MTSPNRPRHLRAIAALAVASVLLLGACGSDSDGGSSDGSSSDGSSASAATISAGRSTRHTGVPAPSDDTKTSPEEVTASTIAPCVSLRPRLSAISRLTS